MDMSKELLGLDVLSVVRVPPCGWSDLAHPSGSAVPGPCAPRPVAHARPLRHVAPDRSRIRSGSSRMPKTPGGSRQPRASTPASPAAQITVVVRLPRALRDALCTRARRRTGGEGRAHNAAAARDTPSAGGRFAMVYVEECGRGQPPSGASMP